MTESKELEEIGRQFLILVKLVNAYGGPLRHTEEPQLQPDRPVQEQIAGELARRGLDPLSVEFTSMGSTVKVQMRRYVEKDLWLQYDAVMRGLQFKWVTDKKDKKNSGWERGE